MSASELKEQLHLAIDSIEDEESLEAVLTILSSRSAISYDLEEKQLKILKEREASYLSGETKAWPLERNSGRNQNKYGF